MRTFLPSCILVCCFLISTSINAQLQKIYLHPKAAGNAKQTQFVDSIRFIPLEAKKGIQVSTNSNVQITEDYFFLNDYSEKKIFLFSKGGAFIKEVNYKHLGTSFYPSYNQHTNQIVLFGNNKNYTLTPTDQIKIRMDWDKPGNRKYFRKYVVDLMDSSFAIQKSIPNQLDIISAYHFYEDYYWQAQIITSPLYEDSADYEVKIYRDNKLAGAFFPYNRVTEPRFLYTQETSAFHKTDTPSVNMVTRPYCDTIYKMVKDSLYPACQLVTPLENSLPASFFTKSFKNKTERENFNRNNGWMFHQVYDFYETPQFIFLLVAYLSNYESYIYQKGTNVTYKTKNIKADTSQYNLQLLTEFNLIRRGDWFYKSHTAGELLTFFEKNKNVPIPEELESFLKSNPPSTARVIVQFKLKS